jgi:hypothetical protein
MILDRNFLADLIWILHMLLIAFVVLVPFVTTKWPILTLHLATVVTLMIHWILDQDACFLTFLESILRGIQHNQSFVHQVVSPVYKIQDENIKRIVWYATPFLGLMSFNKLWRLQPIIRHDLRLILDVIRN